MGIAPMVRRFNRIELLWQEQTMPKPSKPKGKGPCPTFFVAACREASQGGTNGYDRPGYVLVGALGGLTHYEIEEDEWAERLEELSTLIWQGSDEDVPAWFVCWLPRCMALVPRRRRHSFLKGVYCYTRDEGNEIQV
jgi:hypothetical protein